MGMTHWMILLTYSMVQSSSWEANWFAASQEIPRISRNPNVHYRTHTRPPPVSILDQPNPVHKPISHLLEIHPNIIHPSTPRSPQWSLSLRFPHQDPTHPPVLKHTHHMPNPSHSSLDDIHIIIIQVAILVLTTDKCLSFTVIILKETTLDFPTCPPSILLKMQWKANEDFAHK